jgi:ribosome-associated protein
MIETDYAECRRYAGDAASGERSESFISKLESRAIKMAQLAMEKKASDTVVLDLRDLSTIADYFVICSGENPAQIRAIADSIDEYFSREKIYPRGREGLEFARWVLIDYGDIVVHIFDRETREYYDLERFWIDAPRVPVEENE